MERLRCTCQSFMSHRSYIEVNVAWNQRPRREIAGAFFDALVVCRAHRREINNPDAVNLQSLWN